MAAAEARGPRWRALALAPLLVLAGPDARAAAPSWPDLSQAPPDTAKDLPNDVALILAVEDYTARSMPAVAGARANALAWQAYLKARGVRLVKVALDGEVTKEKVLGAPGLKGYAEQIRGERKSGGKVWVVFVGHGAPGEGGGALVGADATRDATSIRTRSIDQEALLRALGRDNGVPIVAVFDTCFSGRTGAGELAPGVQPTVPVYAERAATEQATVLVAASADEYAGPLPGLGQPAFSWLVLGALRGWGDEDGDGMVTAKEAGDWAGARLVELVNDHPQTPAVFGQPDRGLSVGRERAPELPVVRGEPPPPKPGTGKTKDIASDDDLLGDVDQIAATLRAAEALKVQLAATREKELAAGVARIQAQAKDTWAKLGTLRELGGSEAEGKVKAFVAKYGVIEAEYTDAEGRWTKAAVVVEVTEARAWLARGAGASASASAAGGGDWRSPTLGVMKWIPAGTFTMGSPASEAGRGADEVQHRVTLTEGFWLQEHEVTQGEWEAVMGKNPSSFAKCGASCPVERVSWDEAVAFAKAVSSRDGVSYRLPTEAEWEWAARGGQSFTYAGSNELGDVGWYDGNSGQTTHAVCGKRRNGYGLCDMSGNVWEWTSDRYGAYPSGAATDPGGASAGSHRVIRGGSWNLTPAYARVADRSRHSPDHRWYNLGLRLARARP